MCRLIHENILNELSKISSDTLTQSLVKALQDAKGVGNNNTGSGSSCNDVKNTINAASYITGLNCCSQRINLNQLNKADYCGMSNELIQSNVADITNNCLLKNNILMDKSNNISTNIKTDDEHKQSGDTRPSVVWIIVGLIILLVVIGLIGGGIYAFYWYNSKKTKGLL
jgi:hypothetical protein